MEPVAPMGTVVAIDRVTRSFQAMGCQMHLTVASTDLERATRALDMGQQVIAEVEARLSRFRPDSELCRLNAAGGGWQTVSPVLGTVLTLALRAARRTRGLCSPTVLSALEAAGYDRDFDTVRTRAWSAVPATGSPDLTPRTPGAVTAIRTAGAPRQVAARRLRVAGSPTRTGQAWRAIRTEAYGTRVRLPAGVRVDLAGVAKGWTADRVADLLAQTAPCLVDAGGDLSVRGSLPGHDGWPLAIASPFTPDADLALVMVRDGGVATSGTDVRRWSLDGRQQHHLIDPRTGQPARTDALTVSVIAPSTAEADMHAKSALVLGVHGGLTYLQRQRLAGLIVHQDGRLFTTPRWSDYALTS